MEKIIKVDGKELKMVANARVPRLYRNEFNRDLILDMQELTKQFKKSGTSGESIPIEMLTVFENVAWIFLKEGGEQVGNSPDEWLESMDSMFSIYEVLPQILELWRLNQVTTSTPSRKPQSNG